MPPTSFLFLLLLLPSATASQKNIYDVLKYYGFPPGLIPKDVVSGFDLNPNSGQFTVNLKTSCRFTAYNFDVKIKTQIAGVIDRNDIKGLHGVQVQLFNFWVDIMEVEMTEGGEEIEFSSGRAAAEFPVYYFYNIPQCGCGFDCGHIAVAGDSNSNITAPSPTLPEVSNLI